MSHHKKKEVPSITGDELAFGDILGPPNTGKQYRYVYYQFLGRGGYGVTYVVKHQETKYVVKILSLRPALEQKTAPNANGDASTPETGGEHMQQQLGVLKQTSLQQVVNEMKNLQRISRHFGSTRLIESMVLDGHALLFLEYCDAGDLHHEVTRLRRRNTGFPEDTVKVLIVQLTFALYHLHKNGMMHRDVKASNILLCSNGLVKVGDFGLSRTVEYAQTFCGTPTHLAPEVWQFQRYGIKADIWSLGVVMYHLLALQVPFAGQRFDDLKKLIVRGDYVRIKDRGLKYSSDVLALCQRMMTLNVDERPDAIGLLRDPTLTEMVERWPVLLANSGSVTTDVRGRILKCLMDDDLLVQLADGTLRCSPLLTSTDQLTVPVPAASDDAADAFVVDTTTFTEAENRAQARSAQDQYEAPENPALDAIQVPVTIAAAKAAAPATPATPLAGDLGTAVLRKGIVWKAKSVRTETGVSVTRWETRGLMMTSLALNMFVIGADIVTDMVLERADRIASGDINVAAEPTHQRMKFHEVTSFDARPPVVASFAALGLPADACEDIPEQEREEELFPIRIQRRDGKYFDIAMLGQEVRDGWLVAMNQALQAEHARRRARADRSGTASATTLATPTATSGAAK